MSLDPENKRQRNLAKYIGAQFCGCDRLIPLGRHSSFSISIMSRDMWYDECICDLAWWAVGKQIANHASDLHIIDHAWLVGFDAKPNEPWALVTEPYVSADKAAAIVALSNEAMAQWDIAVHLLEPEMSSWNPGSCRPIVAVSSGVRTFMSSAVTWAFSVLQ